MLTLLLAASTTVYGMDRWAALSQIESGDNDLAVGQGGEVSRYQIKPALWCSGAPSDCNAALENAQHIMQLRLTEFEHRFGRPATDFEFYVLWNAPRQVEKPSRIVRERAERFANLCMSHEPPAMAPQPAAPQFLGPPLVVPQSVTVLPVARQSVALPPVGPQSVMVVASRAN
jgi:hypothetical protein